MSSMNADTTAALDRLIDLAKSDTGQARRVANLLLAWWNGPECGGLDIADLFSVDRDIAADMAQVFAFLGEHPGAIYPDAFGHRDSMVELVEAWRPERQAA